jgi:hypothetical protein
MADLMGQIADIERRVKVLGLPMSFVCKWADVPKESWSRWKAGTRHPLKETWDKIAEAVDDLERRLKR